ncbi:LANO_0G05314g1_1 [Lachancea nothofagi CBS 11611]|uniref:Altered inheritance of mitochondria protein 23, mitochondrial n=1 Tax=Lachancea nothofagi CBS 11611 TaxID=1266666 RepID=A0A1G4KGK4_9SACH|nr:LANO_0G05314g1_1 [Lachancea nothofagi CBS 11611]
MSSLPSLYSRLWTYHISARRLSRAHRCFHAAKPVLSSSISSSNDILFNATASMRKNKETAKLNGPRSHPSSNGQSRRKPFKPSGPGHNIKKRTVVKWSTGSERAQSAANHTLQQIFKLNERGVIRVVDQETNQLEETTILTWAAGLDLGQFGITIVNVEQRGTYSIPLVKLVDTKTALKKYSDELARQKEEELTKMGFSNKRLGKKVEKDNGEDNVKQIKVSWQISDADLNKQKANEITSQLKKGYKVFLYLNGREALNKSTWAEDIASPESENDSNAKKISAKELQRRQSVVDLIEEIVGDYALQPSVDGNIESRLIIKLTPKPTAHKKEDKTALKEERKLQRQAKLLKKVEKKKDKEPEEF